MGKERIAQSEYTSVWQKHTNTVAESCRKVCKQTNRRRKQLHKITSGIKNTQHIVYVLRKQQFLVTAFCRRRLFSSFVRWTLALANVVVFDFNQTVTILYKWQLVRDFSTTQRHMMDSPEKYKKNSKAIKTTASKTPKSKSQQPRQ